MPSWKDSTNRSETFGRLLSGAINSIATYEGKTAPIIEEELGALAVVAGKTIQRYKAGHLPPEARTIEILAEAATRRGFLGREWLQRFLHAARYPFADKLLDQLCQIGPVRPRPPRVYHNLPAPTYRQFVMRAQAFAEVQEGLNKQSSIVIIVGLGGNGKTSLAREVAAQCIQEENDSPPFDGVVWIGDKDRPGMTNLSIVLDTIARTLDYPGFTRFEHDEKRREVENLLLRQRILIVVDNFETINDSTLLAWLQNLSEPSKALITTREYRREYRRGGWLVELRGMTDAESHKFANERLRVLRIEKLIHNLPQIEPLVAVTGGNPKAIELALGLVKYERRLLQQVVDDLYAARGELFDDLFSRSWVLLDESARCVLLVMTFFPANASSAALAATANVHEFAFDRAVERLTDLALLDVQHPVLHRPPRYALHPLVRVFACMQLVEQMEFEARARTRWMEWYIQLVSNVGYCWDNLSRLELLESEQETIMIAADWAFQRQRYLDVVKIAKGAEYYYHVRGQWDKWIRLKYLCADAAHAIEDRDSEIQALANIVEALSLQRNLVKAAKSLDRLQIMKQSKKIPNEYIFDFHYASAFYAMARDDFISARQIWEEALESHLLFPTNYPRKIVAQRWIARCLYREGRISEASTLLQQTLLEAIQIGHQRAIIFCEAERAAIAIDQGNFESAAQELERARYLAVQYDARESVALIQRISARLSILCGDLPAARAALTTAIDLFERLGMRQERSEASDTLAQLEVS